MATDDTVVLAEDVVLQYENGTSYNAARKGQVVSAAQAAEWGAAVAEPEPEPEPAEEPVKPRNARAKKDEV